MMYICQVCKEKAGKLGETWFTEVPCLTHLTPSISSELRPSWYPRALATPSLCDTLMDAHHLQTPQPIRVQS